MKKENKKDSIKYWDQNARNWPEVFYDREKTYLQFPTSQQRQDITINLLEKLSVSKNASVIDIGCADGELVKTLFKRGFNNVKGIDNSKGMIDTAKERLKKEMPGIAPEKIFFVEDADRLDKSKTFDFITAMGLIAYLMDVEGFFQDLYDILNPGGYAFVESRNKLFNLFSANQRASRASVEDLVEELKDVGRLSPFKEDKQIENIVKKTFISVGETIKRLGLDEEIKKSEKFASFPFALPQFTPKEIEKFCEKHSLKLEYVVYYHIHPFLPKFEDNFPITFNRIALQMQPLGYTPLAATMCSSFIAVIKKTK